MGNAVVERRTWTVAVAFVGGAVVELGEWVGEVRIVGPGSVGCWRGSFQGGGSGRGGGRLQVVAEGEIDKKEVVE